MPRNRKPSNSDDDMVLFSRENEAEKVLSQMNIPPDIFDLIQEFRDKHNLHSSVIEEGQDSAFLVVKQLSLEMQSMLGDATQYLALRESLLSLARTQCDRDRIAELDAKYKHLKSKQGDIAFAISKSHVNTIKSFLLSKDGAISALVLVVLLMCVKVFFNGSNTNKTPGHTQIERVSPGTGSR